MVRSFVLISMLALSLAACGPADFGNKKSDAGGGVAAPKVRSDVAAVHPTTFETDIKIIPSEATLNIPLGLQASLEENGTLKIAGVPRNNSPGIKTGGVAFELGPDVEEFVGGNVSNVRIVAKGSSSSIMRVAYSTNENGTSGWKEFSLSDVWEEYSFKISFRPPVDGNGDYLGISPVNGEITVAVAGIDHIRPRNDQAQKRENP